MNQCTKAIGIVNPDAEVTPTEKYHVTVCHDISENMEDWYVLPTIEMFEEVLEFSKGFVEYDKVMIHCSAGIARSTATALMVLLQHGATIEEAYDIVFEARPHMNPNTLILSFADNLLGYSGELIDYHKKWAKNKRINPTNFAGQKLANPEIDTMKKMLARL